MAFIPHHIQVHMVFVFGILGNVLSFLVYLAPLPTFLRIYKKKSTEGFQSIPYSVALFSAMLTLYYGFLKPNNGTLLITINSVGILIESAYIFTFMIYAPRDAKIYTSKLLALFNGLVFGTIIFSTLMFSHGDQRVEIVGWTCAVFSVCVFVAPLSIMRLVIRTKSVEFMPFFLSFFLTLCAVMWFFYGILSNDYFVATPNVLGFAFGIVQMILYKIYKGKNKQAILPIVKVESEMEMKTTEKEEDDTKKEQKSSKPADHEEVVVVLAVLVIDDDKEVTPSNTLTVESK